MRWTFSLLAVPLLYVLSVPWVVRLDSKMFGFTFSDKFSAYYGPWKWLAESAPTRFLLWDYSLWCDGLAGESSPPSRLTIFLMHPQEQP